MAEKNQSSNEDVSLQEEEAVQPQVDTSQVNPALKSVLSGEVFSDAADAIKSKVKDFEVEDLVPEHARDISEFVLEQSGLITPETVNNLEILRDRGLLTQEQVDKKRREYGLLSPEQEQSEQFRQEAIAPILEGTAIEPKLPEGTGTVLAPTESPYLAEVAKDKIWAQEQRERDAQEALLKKAQEDEMQAMEAEAARRAEAEQRQSAAAAKKREETVQQAVKEVEADTEATVTEESGPTGIMREASPIQKKVRHVIAVLLGGLAQGLTGDKTNPVLDYLDKEFEKELENRRFDEKKKNELRRAMIEQMQLQMKQREHLLRTDDHKRKWAETNLKLEKFKQEATQSAVQQKLLKDNVFSAEQLATLPNELAERAVRIPGTNEFTLVPSKQQANKINDEAAGLANADQDLAALSALNKKFGNNPIAKILNRSDIARSETLQQAVIGNLRILLFGPGVITDNERAIAENIVRDPSRIFSLSSANQAALDVMLNKVKYAMRDRIRQSGGNVPLTQNEENIRRLMKANPKLTKAEAANALQKTNRWVPEI